MSKKLKNKFLPHFPHRFKSVLTLCFILTLCKTLCLCKLTNCIILFYFLTKALVLFSFPAIFFSGSKTFLIFFNRAANENFEESPND